MTDRQEMIDFLSNRTDPVTTRRIVNELEDPASFASAFIDEVRGQAEELLDVVDWKKVAGLENGSESEPSRSSQG